MDSVQHMRRWLANKARFLDTNAEVFEGFCSELVSLDIPLDRSWLHIRTLHPQFAGMSRLWQRDTGAIEERYLEHNFEKSETYLASPVRDAVEGRRSGRWRLNAGTPLPFPVLEDLRRAGYTDYAVAPLAYSDGTQNAISWATRSATGFDGRTLGLLDELLPDFAAIAEIKSLRRFASNMLHTYAGREPGELILKGQIRRGDVRTIAGALMLIDLRDFTRMSDTRAPKEVIGELNRYFDAMMPPITHHGGEVMEIMGDGILAFFGDDTAGGAAAACQSALAAAKEGIAAIERSNTEAGSDVPLRAGCALHHGSVAYGNIGSGDRLDFTVIGRDVNLTSRIERLCRELNTSLLMSSEFAVLVGQPMLELGHFTLRGVPQMQLLFGLPPSS